MTEYSGFYAEWPRAWVIALWVIALAVPSLIVVIMALLDKWKADKYRRLDDRS